RHRRARYDAARRGDASARPTRRRLMALRSMVLPALALGATLAVFAPILRNYFASDDFLHMYEMVNLPLANFLLAPFGGHVYLVRNTIFLLTYRLFGPVPLPFLAMALLTHLVNVLLLYRLIRVVTGSAALACAGATTWGASPLAEGAIGWYSVYG